MKNKIKKLKKIKLKRSLKIRLFVALFILTIFLFVFISYMKTYSDYVTKPGSRVEGGTVYINDLASDYYHYKGMNYVGDVDNSEVDYNDQNLVPVTINYYGHAKGVTTCDDNDKTNCGYVSLTEKQYKFVYYKYYPTDGNYINIELIDNPFIDRPTNKGFGGWVNETGTLTKNSDTLVQTLRVPITYTNYIPNEVEVNLYTSWLDANVIYLNGEVGDDNFDGSYDDPVGSWGRAFQLLRENSDDVNDRERNIIVLTGNISNSFNFTQSLTHNWNTTIDYTDNQTFTSGETYIIEYVNNNNRYALIDDGAINYELLSTSEEPLDNTKWRLVSVDGGYTIQNIDTNHYLSYEVVETAVNLIPSNTETVWSYNSTTRNFYIAATISGTVYDYTNSPSFTAGNTYRITREAGGVVNALNFPNTTTVNNQELVVNVEPNNNSAFLIASSGTGYTIRNRSNNYYLSGIDSGDSTGTLSPSYNTTYAVWNYDSENQSFYRTISINYPTIGYTHSTTAQTGTRYLTTGNDQDAINAIGNTGNTITNNILTSTNSFEENCAWTVTLYNNNRYRFQNNGRYLYNQSGTLTLATSATNWYYSNSYIYSRSNSVNYYLRLNNGTWSLVTGQANATRIYFTSTTVDNDYRDVVHYLSYENDLWSVKTEQDDTTRLTFTTYDSREVTETNDYHLYYDEGYSLNKDAYSSLNFATYVRNRTITNTTSGAISANNYYTTTTNIAATVTSLYNGVDYRNDATINLTSAGSARAAILARNDLQLEYLSISANGYNVINNGSASTSYVNNYASLSGNYNNVRVGRGMTPGSWTNTSSTTFAFAYGGSNSSSVGSTSNDDHAFRFVIESGRYSGLMAMRSRNDGNGSSYNHYGTMEFVLGSDYDRVTNNNDTMDVYYRTASSNNYGVNGTNDNSAPAYLMRVKSGKYGIYFFENNQTDDERAYSGIYVGGLTVTTSTTTRDISGRVLVVEGGRIANVIGGLRLNSTEQNTVKTRIYVKGGVVSNIVGGAGVSTTYGDRFISVTGGEVEYSVSGGSNGYLATSSTGQDNGQLAGNTYVHIGGNAQIGTIGTGSLYDVAAGSVLGAGDGNSSITNSGRVNYANLYVSDEAIIHGSLYGGGNYGNVVNNVNILLDGGTIIGSVYGGANQNGVGTVTISQSAVTNVSYNDASSFSNNGTYAITYVNGTVRNALTGTNTSITNSTLSTTASPNANVSWTISQSGSGYTIRNNNGRYLVAEPGVGSPTLTTDTILTNAVWQYDSARRSFRRQAEVITSSTVTYNPQTTFTSGNEYILTNTNTGTLNALTGSTSSLSNTALSTSSIPLDTTKWLITASGSGYTIQNVDTGYYLGYNQTGSFWSYSYTLAMTTTATVWSYNTSSRAFYNYLASSWSGSQNYYLYYSNGWSMNTQATSLYFTTYTAVNETSTNDYYITYNNGWSLTTGTPVQLNFTTYNDITRVSATASNKSYGNVTITMNDGTVQNTIYGGACITGNIAGLVDININGGTINKSDEHNGSIYGGGYGEATYVASGVNLDIKDTSSNLTVNGSIYGGSALGTVIGDINVTVMDDTTTNRVITLNDDVYCGSMGTLNSSANGNITGSCNILVKGGTYPNSVYGGNNFNGSAYGDITVTIGGDDVKTTVGNVYGGGDQADSQALSNEVYILSDSDIGSVYGGGDEALVDTTYVYLNGGKVTNAFGGSNAASLTTSNVFLQGSTVTNIYGGSNQSGDVVTTNITTTSGTATNIYGGNNLGGSVSGANILVNGGTIESAYGGGNLAPVTSTTVEINSGTVTNAFGGGNEALVDTAVVNLNGGTIESTYGGGNQAGIQTSTKVTLDGATTTRIFGGSNQSGVVAVTNVETLSGTSQEIYGGNNLGGSTTTSNVLINGGNINTVYGGGNEALVNTTNVTLNSGTVTSAFGGGNQAGIDKETNVTLNGSMVGNIYGGSNQSGTVPLTKITTNSGTVTTIYGGNNLGGSSTNTNIIIDGANITNVYGGGNQADSNVTNITLNGADNRITSIYGGGNQASVATTNINLINGEATSVYGGSNQSGTITNSNVTVTNGNYSTIYGGNNAGGKTTNSSVKVLGGVTGNLFGGGNEAVTDDTSLEVTGGTITNIYGGGNQAAITNNTNVIIGEAIITNDVFGGGNFGVVGKDTLVDIKKATINGSAYAGGNGQSATVLGNTNINVHGATVIDKHVFGGGNAANTGDETSNNSKGVVNVAGGTIGGNVYGGANTAVLYGETTVNIGYNAVIGSSGTPVGMTYDPTNYSYKNSEGTITMDSAFMRTTGSHWNDYLTVKNDLGVSINNYTLVLYTGRNTMTACYNCFYETDGNGYTTIRPRTDWTFTLASNSSYVLQGSWTLVDTSEIRVVGYYTNRITDPVLETNSSYEKSDVNIAGTVFGGGEANAAGAEEYDWNFKSVTVGITVNIDGEGHDNFDILGSIFGSGNASTSGGYSYINISNYGTDLDIKRNISLQRTDLATISNSHIELMGAVDRTNEYSSTLFSISLVNELKIKNNTSIYLYTGANALAKFYSLVDINGTETKAAVTINENTGEITKNVNNRLYIQENEVVNISASQTLDTYGDVDGMTFFGMYRHDRSDNIVSALYDEQYGQGDAIDSSELYYFNSGTYVVGRRKTNHDIKIDGFYTNYENEDDLGHIRVNYINPTQPENASYYMWVVGTKPVSLDVDLEASKYATLGINELQLMDYLEPNTKFSIVGFTYDDLDPNVSLVDPNTIPKIAATDFDADNKLGLTVKTGSNGWITIGETTFLTDSDTLWYGTTDYQKENSYTTPSLVFYFYHSKNLKTEGDLGTAVISLLLVIPVDDLTNRVMRVDINVHMSRHLYPTDNYEGTMTPGREYQLFSTSRTDITATSSLSAYYSLFVDSEKDIYGEGYHHALVSTFMFPINTRITLIDLASGDKPEYYYYIVNENDYASSAAEYNTVSETSYLLSKFIKMGSSSRDNNFNEALKNDIYYDDVLKAAFEEFIVIVDFFDSDIQEDQLENTLLMELRNEEGYTLYSVLGPQHVNMTYNLYANKDAIIDIAGKLSNSTVYLGNSTQLTVTTNFFQQTNNNGAVIYDTNYYENQLGIKITLMDQNGNQVNGVDMMGISFTLGDVTYYPRSDGSIRINLAERVANVESRIIIDTRNSNLSSGIYEMKIESFYSPDGIYYGLISSDMVTLELQILEKLYGLEVLADDEMLIIDKDTGNNASASNHTKFTVKYSSGLNTPNIKIALYRRNYDSVYDISYALVDLNEYLVYQLRKSNFEYIYDIFQTPSASQEIILNFKDGLKTGTYKLEFRLYDVDVYIGEVSKYIVIR